MIRTLTLNGDTINYVLERRKRKSISVRIKDDGSILVSAPKWITIKYIEEFLISRFDWIVNKSRESKKRSIEAMKDYSDGAVIHSMGEDYLLKIVIAKDAKRYTLKKSDDYLIVTGPDYSQDTVKELIARWNKKRLRAYIIQRVEYYKPYIASFGLSKGIVPTDITKISIKNVKSRWGSCSNKGSLNFSSKLALAPLSLTDYVIVHEMCHLLYMNHSKDFWEAVTYIIPDQNTRRKQLRENGWKYNM